MGCSQQKLELKVKVVVFKITFTAGYQGPADRDSAGELLQHPQ